MIEQLKRMLTEDEGEVNHAYRDSEGYLTIGVGRLIDKDKGGGISHEEAMILLDNDIAKVISRCEVGLGWFKNLDETRKIVILNMVFNMGFNNFLEFKKTIAYIKDSNYEEAAIEMLDSKWAGQVGRRAAKLSSVMKTGKI